MASNVVVRVLFLAHGRADHTVRVPRGLKPGGHGKRIVFMREMEIFQRKEVIHRRGLRHNARLCQFSSSQLTRMPYEYIATYILRNQVRLLKNWFPVCMEGEMEI